MSGGETVGVIVGLSCKYLNSAEFWSNYAIICGRGRSSGVLFCTDWAEQIDTLIMLGSIVSSKLHL